MIVDSPTYVMSLQPRDHPGFFIFILKLLVFKFIMPGIYMYMYSHMQQRWRPALHIYIAKWDI